MTTTALPPTPEDTTYNAESIDSGQRWRNQLSLRLRSIRTGIVCLCPENLLSIAIHFEAGALSRQVDDNTRLIPYCFDLRPADVTWPLSDFQGRSANQDDTWKLAKSINLAMPTPLQEARLAACFESLWPRLEKTLCELPPRPTEGVQPARTPEQMMVEVLDLVRSIEREVTIDRIRQLRDAARRAAFAAAYAGASRVPGTTAVLIEEQVEQPQEKAFAQEGSVGLTAMLAAAMADPPV